MFEMSMCLYDFRWIRASAAGLQSHQHYLHFHLVFILQYFGARLQCMKRNIYRRSDSRASAHGRNDEMIEPGTRQKGTA